MLLAELSQVLRAHSERTAKEGGQILMLLVFKVGAPDRKVESEEEK